MSQNPAAFALRMVACPACRGQSVYAQSNPYRPFCSQRCKNMDFGAWASEGFSVAAQAEADEADDAGELGALRAQQPRPTGLQ